MYLQCGCARRPTEDIKAPPNERKIYTFCRTCVVNSERREKKLLINYIFPGCMGSAQHHTRSWAGYLIYAKWRQTNNGWDEIVQTVETVFFCDEIVKLFADWRRSTCDETTYDFSHLHIRPDDAKEKFRLWNRKKFTSFAFKHHHHHCWRSFTTSSFSTSVWDRDAVAHIAALACSDLDVSWPGRKPSLLCCALEWCDVAMGVGHTTVKKDSSSEKKRNKNVK